MEVHPPFEYRLLEVVWLHGVVELGMGRAVAGVNDLASVVIRHVYRSRQRTCAYVVKRVDAGRIHRAIVLRLTRVTSERLAFSVRKWSHVGARRGGIVGQIGHDRRIDPRV